MTHVEVDSKGKWTLFDYKRRDPLTKDAKNVSDSGTEGRGKGMIRDYVALDLEMDGTEPEKKMRSLEIGAVKVRDMGSDGDLHCHGKSRISGSGACHRADRDHDRNGTAGQGNPHGIAGISGILWTIRDPWA